MKIPVKRVTLFSSMLIFFLFFSTVSAISFKIVDPEDVENANFDIISAGAYKIGDIQYFWLGVRNEINLTPSNYTKNYEVNITFQDAYLHLYVVIWENKNDVMSFAKSPKGLNYEFDNYTIEKGNITFWLSDRCIEKYGNITRVVFIAGEENLKRNVVKSLDFAYYPPQRTSEKEDGFSYLYLILSIIFAALISALIYMWWRNKKNKKIFN